MIYSPFEKKEKPILPSFGYKREICLFVPLYGWIVLPAKKIPKNLVPGGPLGPTTLPQYYLRTKRLLGSLVPYKTMMPLVSYIPSSF